MRNPFHLSPEQAHFAPELERAVADSDMYFAKTHGRNRSVGLVAGDHIQEGSDILNSLEQSLEQTLADDLVRLVE